MKTWYLILAAGVGVSVDFGFSSQLVNYFLAFFPKGYVGSLISYSLAYLAGVPAFCVTALFWDRNFFFAQKTAELPQLPQTITPALAATAAETGIVAATSNLPPASQQTVDPRILAVLSKMTKTQEKMDKRLKYYESLPAVKPYIERAGDGFPKKGFHVKEAPTTNELFQGIKKPITQPKTLPKEQDPPDSLYS